ncbi:uncharacterized protein LOC134399722 [Elgaria multicarinata webbii]|uniref:uncharacterized protein LOC134399722 n=1 Tax=Elgaria multicarinata webbii TaxID=159646 RepID=UPI002FCD5109
MGLELPNLKMTTELLITLGESQVATATAKEAAREGREFAGQESEQDSARFRFPGRAGRVALQVRLGARRRFLRALAAGGAAACPPLDPPPPAGGEASGSLELAVGRRRSPGGPPSSGPRATGLGLGSPRSLFLALLCSYSCFQGTVSAAKLQSNISSPLQYKPSFGQKLSVLCEGYMASGCSGVMYWLANGTFVDNLYPEEAVSEKDTTENAKDTGCFLARELLFYSFSQRDLDTKFECIVLDPSGPVRKTVTWELQDAKEGGKGAPVGC